jgi:ankyrin repeat protein
MRKENDKIIDLVAADQDAWCPLQLAAKRGDLDIIIALLDKDPTLISKKMSFRNATALRVAMGVGNLKIAEYLLSRGAKISEVYIGEVNKQCLPLYTQKVEELLEEGVRSNMTLYEEPPDSQDEKHRNYSDYAIEIDQLPQFFKRCEARDNAPSVHAQPNDNGWFPLQLAAKNGDLQEIQSLLAKDYSLIAKRMPFRNATALRVAMGCGEVAVAKYLLSLGAKIFEVDRAELQEPACLALYDEIIRHILEEAIRLNKDLRTIPAGSKTESRTYLDYAAEIAYFAAFKKALEANGDDLFKMYSGDTPLFSAIRNKSLDIIKFIAKNIKGIDQFGQRFTPLQYAIKCRKWEAVEILLEYGADINKPDRQGMSPLHLAIIYGYGEMIPKLIKYNANIYAVTHYGDTILHTAVLSDIDMEQILDPKQYASLKGIKNVRGQTAQQAKENKLPDLVGQDSIIPNITHYIEQMNLNKDLLSDGYCNALIFLDFVYDSIGEYEHFKQALRLWRNWDRNVATLQSDPPRPLSDRYKTIQEVFKVSHAVLIWFQANYFIKSTYQFQQWDRHLQLAKLYDYLQRELHLTEAECKKYLNFPDHLYYVCQSYSHFINKEKFLQLVEIFAALPPMTRISLSGGSHATGFTTGFNRQSRYFDSNHSLEESLLLEPEYLTKFVIGTKYDLLNATSYFDDTVNYEVHFSAYRLPGDNLTYTYNYFTADNLPKTTSEVAAFIALPTNPNRFSPLHIAILTNSMENTKDLLASGISDLKYRDANRDSVLDIAKNAGNESARCLLEHAQEISARNQLAFFKSSVNINENSQHNAFYPAIRQENSSSSDNEFESQRQCNTQAIFG